MATTSTTRTAVPQRASRSRPARKAATPAPAGDLEAALGATIADRVRTFRRQLSWTVGELATRSGLSKGMLSKIENAQASPSLSTLARLSEALSVPVTAFFRGLDEEQDVLFVKAGSGLEIRHKEAQRGRHYQMLGRMRSPYDHFEPMLTTVTERADSFPLYQHAGTELIFMLEGSMEYGYGASRYLLEPGDSLQFVGEVTHGPAAILDLPVRFLAIKATGGG
ncbi:MAG: helix-turn-helix domain-containing protein [Mycobacteriales bacterium]